MQQFISPELFEAFFTSEGTIWETIWILIKLGLIIWIPIESYKYVKDCYYLRTFHWHRQWRCREAMLRREACLRYLTMNLRDYSDSEKICKEMIKLATKWDELTTAHSENYEKLWFETHSYCNTNRYFRAAYDLYQHSEGKNLYQKYGYIP